MSLGYVRDAITNQTGVTAGLTQSNPASVLDVLPSSIKTAAEANKCTIIGQGHAVPFWVIDDRIIYFGGSTNSGTNPNNTAKLQGDLAYEALKARIVWDLAVNAGRSTAEKSALESDYNTKIARVYAA